MSTRTSKAVNKTKAASKGKATTAKKQSSKQQTVTLTPERTSKRFGIFVAEKLVPRLYVAKTVIELLSTQKTLDLTFDSPRVTKGGKLTFAEVGENSATCGLYLNPADAKKLGIGIESASVKARLVLDGENVKLTVIA